MCDTTGRQPAAISILRSTKGNLNKRILLNPFNGAVTTDHPLPMSEGWASYHPAPTSKELYDLLQGMTMEHALVLGTLKDPRDYDLPVLSKRKGGLSTRRHVIRSKQFFHFDKNRETWVLLDYDTKFMPEAVTQRVAEAGGWFSALQMLWPQVVQADRVDPASSSSHVYRADGTPLRETATHTYVRFFEPGLTQKQLLDDLMLRGWLHGLSYWHIGDAGQLLERGIIDAAVGSPERLSFEAAPTLVGDLTRSAPPPRITQGMCIGYTVLNVAERAQAISLRAAVKDSLRVKAQAVRAAWTIKRATELAAEGGITYEQALATIKGVFVGERQLVGEYAVLLSDNTSATVNQILDDPYRYHMVDGPGILDGPEYGRSRIQIVTLTKDGKPLKDPHIYDYSHGETVKYKLVRVSKQPSVALEREIRLQASGAQPRALTYLEQMQAIKARNEYQFNQHIRLWKTEFLPFLNARKNKPKDTDKNLDAKMKAYFEHEDISNAPRWWDASQTGVGKSYASAAFLRWATSDDHSGWERSKHGKFVVVLERHEQSKQLLKKLGGLNVVALLGRGKVCEYPDLIGKFGGLVDSVENSVCKHCPLYDSCQYYKQIKKAKKADIVIMVREMAYHNPVGLIGRRVALWLFDEDQTSSLVEEPVLVTAGDLRPTMHGTFIPYKVTNVLARLAATLEGSHKGGAVLPPNDPDLGEAIEYFTPQHGFGVNSMSDVKAFGEALQTKMDTVGPVMQWRKRMYAFLCALETSDPHVPGAYVDMLVRVGQLPQLGFVLVQRKSAGGIATCRNAPRVLYSATAREYWNSLGLCFGPPDRDNISLPAYVTIRLMDCHTGSKSSLLDVNGNPTKLLEDLVTHYETQATGKLNLFLAQKAVTEAVSGRFGEDSVLMHHGANSGINDAEGATYSISIGRGLPSFVVYEAQVEALTGRCVTRLSPNEQFWPRKECWVRCGPHHCLATIGYTHPDPTVAAYLDYELSTQIEQGIGRPRAIRAKEPMIIDIFGQVPVGYPVDQLGSLQDFRAGPEELICRTGMIPLSGEAVNKLAPALYPNVFGSAEQLKWARKAEQKKQATREEVQLLSKAAGASPVLRLSGTPLSHCPEYGLAFLVSVPGHKRGVPVGFPIAFSKKDCEKLVNRLLQPQSIGRYRPARVG